MDDETLKKVWTGIGSMVQPEDTYLPGTQEKTQIQNQDLTTSTTPVQTSCFSPCFKKEELAKTIDQKGRTDYAEGELVYVLFQNEQGQIIDNFGIVQQVMGEQYVIKLMTEAQNELAVVTINAIRGAGLA